MDHDTEMMIMTHARIAGSYRTAMRAALGVLDEVGLGQGAQAARARHHAEQFRTRIAQSDSALDALAKYTSKPAVVATDDDGAVERVER